jgi:hypothetical protein
MVARLRDEIKQSNQPTPFTFPPIPLSLSLPMDQVLAAQLTPGTKVRVTQQIAARNYTWTTDVAGTVVQFQQQSTGSWYAHGKDDKLWLDRLTLRKTDGEITTLILDEYSRVELEDPAAAAK